MRLQALILLFYLSLQLVRYKGGSESYISENNKQLLDEVEHDIMNYQNRGLCYLPQPSASADNTVTRF